MAGPGGVVIGGGFAGYTAAKALSKVFRANDGVVGNVEIVLINPTDYFLYLPLLPEVSAGVLEPRRVTVSLSSALPKVKILLGTADDFDLDAKTVGYSDPDGVRHTMTYDRLLLAAGSVNKLLPIPGVTEYAHGYRGIPEALFLRDHMTRQIEMAMTSTDEKESK